MQNRIPVENTSYHRTTLPQLNLALDENEKMIIRQAGSAIHYPRGHAVFFANDKSDRIFLLESGWVKIYRLSPDGRKVTVGSIRNPGELIGLAETILGVYRTCYAGAICNVSTIVVSKEKFEELMAEHSFLAVKVAKLLSARMREAESINQDLVCRQASGRLALLLMRVCERMGEKTQNGIKINLKLTHEEIANMVGTSRQTVTSILSTFKQENSVIYEGKAIRIIHPDKLAKWVV